MACECEEVARSRGGHRECAGVGGGAVGLSRAADFVICFDQLLVSMWEGWLRWGWHAETCPRSHMHSKHSRCPRTHRGL
jgi:hypothetical protein